MNRFDSSDIVIHVLVESGSINHKIQSYPIGSIKGMLLIEHVGIVRPIVSFVAFHKV